MIDRRAVEDFIFLEARLMDEMDYAGWYALWDRDGVYHVPIGSDAINRERRQVSIINDDYVRLEQRVKRLESGSVLAVAGQKGAMRRIVSNIELLTTAPEGELEVASNFVLGIARSAEQQLWIGRSLHRLRPNGDSFRIARKTVLLINSTHETPLLQFLI